MLDRLTKADYNSGQSDAYSLQYGYDAAGNRISTSSTVAGNADTTGYNYDDTNQLLTATTNGQASSYTWDNNGRGAPPEFTEGATC